MSKARLPRLAALLVLCVPGLALLRLVPVRAFLGPLLEWAGAG